MRCAACRKHNARASPSATLSHSDTPRPFDSTSEAHPLHACNPLCPGSSHPSSPVRGHTQPSYPTHHHTRPQSTASKIEFGGSFHAVRCGVRRCALATVARTDLTLSSFTGRRLRLACAGEKSLSLIVWARPVDNLDRRIFSPNAIPRSITAWCAPSRRRSCTRLLFLLGAPIRLAVIRLQ